METICNSNVLYSRCCLLGEMFSSSSVNGQLKDALIRRIDSVPRVDGYTPTWVYSQTFDAMAYCTYNQLNEKAFYPLTHQKITSQRLLVEALENDFHCSDYGSKKGRLTLNTAIIRNIESIMDGRLSIQSVRECFNCSRCPACQLFQYQRTIIKVMLQRQSINWGISYVYAKHSFKKSRKLAPDIYCDQFLDIYSDYIDLLQVSNIPSK